MVDISILQDILLNPVVLADILAEELDDNSSTNKKKIQTVHQHLETEIEAMLLKRWTTYRMQNSLGCLG